MFELTGRLVTRTNTDKQTAIVVQADIQSVMTRRIKIKSVIFDLGNVVLDWDVDRILGSIGVSESEQKLLRAELFSHQDWVDMDHGKKAESDVLADVCARTHLRKDIVERVLLAAKTSLDTIPATIDLIKQIKEHEISVYCLSNMSKETFEHIKGRDFLKLFDGVVISGVEGCMKPETEVFELTAQRFNLKPASTLFVDDSAVNIKAAKELGFSVLHFKRSNECHDRIKSLLNLNGR